MPARARASMAADRSGRVSSYKPSTGPRGRPFLRPKLEFRTAPTRWVRELADAGTLAARFQHCRRRLGVHLWSVRMASCQCGHVCCNSGRILRLSFPKRMFIGIPDRSYYRRQFPAVLGRVRVQSVCPHRLPRRSLPYAEEGGARGAYPPASCGRSSRSGELGRAEGREKRARERKGRRSEGEGKGKEGGEGEESLGTAVP